MTIHNLGSKTDLLELHNNAVVASTGAGTPANVDLVDYEGDVAFIIDAAAAGSGVTLNPSAAATTPSDHVDQGLTANDAGGPGRQNWGSPRGFPL